MCWLYPTVEMEVNNITDLKELEADKQLDYNSMFIMVLYTTQVMALLGVTTALKMFFARPRPA